jgi:hypothetical protein
MIQKTASVIAVIFGVLTLVASSRILYLGSDPGYVVFMPLLIFNHIMGVCYLIAGYLIWRNSQQGKMGALVVFLLNLIVLLTIFVVYLKGSGVATDSLGAMTFRTIVWLLIFISFKNIRKKTFK